MPVAIRLSRIGTKHKPFFRVVVVDSRKKRDGECLENIGTYDAVKGQLVCFYAERYDAWVKQGAQPTDTAKKLYRLSKKKAVEADQPKTVVKKAAAPKKEAVAEKSSATTSA